MQWNFLSWAIGTPRKRVRRLRANVFTIAKLRSSGSDISKLQEVGRGLRLPVDECGNRISNEEFTLNYIVDFTEADFAECELCRAIDAEAVGHRGGCQFRTVGDRFEALAALFRELTLGVCLSVGVGG